MNLRCTRDYLWGRLIALRIDAQLMEIAGCYPKDLRTLKIQALEVYTQLQAECTRVLQ